MSSPHTPDEGHDETVSLDKNTMPPAGAHEQSYPTPPPYGQAAYDPSAYPQQPYGQPAYDPNNPYGQQQAYPQQPPPGAGYDQGQYGGAYPQGGYPPAGYPQQPAYAEQPPAYPGYAQPYPASRGTNTMAILALVFGIILAPLGLIFGFVARSQIKKTGEDGDGLALAGIIIGGIFTLLFIAYIVFIVIFFAAVANSVPSSGY
ncbi:MAG TPA: DUF4190 domain-containing protein [Pseudonocardia sp.]